MDIFSSHETQNIPEDSIVSVFGLVGKRHSTVCLGFRFKQMVCIESSVKNDENENDEGGRSNGSRRGSGGIGGVVVGGSRRRRQPL